MKYYGVIFKSNVLSKYYTLNTKWPLELYETAAYARGKAKKYADMIERNSTLIEKQMHWVNTDISKLISDNTITVTINCTDRKDVIYIYVKEFEVEEA